jgi:hypothetical protein
MSDPDNARYRLLSFKYTPTNTLGVDKHGIPSAGAEKADHPHDGSLPCAKPAPLPTEKESELPSLSCLAKALPVVDATPPPDTDQGVLSEANMDPDAETETATAPRAGEKAAPILPPSGPRFHLFNDLPAELRIKIWHMTFLPRAVELHPTRPNYARDTGRQQNWQSGCSNPAALSVSSEARQIALSHFRIPFPLYSITSQQEGNNPSSHADSAAGPFARYLTYTAAPQPGGMYNFSGPSATGKASLRSRTLHVSPQTDTVALLGQDSDFAKLSGLLASFREADPLGEGIRSLSLSTRSWGYGGSAAMMRSLNRTILRDIGQLTLFMYGEALPPAGWNARGASLDEESLRQFKEEGNRCGLVPCDVEGSSASYAYRIWCSEKGRQFWDSEGKIMKVGRSELKIMDLVFSAGW